MEEQSTMSQDIDFEKLLDHAGQQLDKLIVRSTLEKQLAKSMLLKFETNIQALNKYLPNLAKEFRHYKPQNVQLFCSPSGELNLVDHRTNHPLYGEQPQQQCEEQVVRNIADPLFTSLHFSGDENAKNKDNLHEYYLTKIHNEYLKASKHLEPLRSVPEHIGSSIIFGIGLGYHLQPFIDKINVDFLYIVEPNRDWFFLSLYCCDWAYFLEQIDQRDGVLTVDVGTEYETFINEFCSTLDSKIAFNATNTLIYQHYPSDQMSKIITTFQKKLHLTAVGWGFFDDSVISIAHEMANGSQQVPILKGSAALPRRWLAMPVFIVANGPSLDECFDTIKAYKEKVILISCGTALQTLLKNNIIPDFHIVVERTKSSFDFIDRFCDKELLKQINLLTVTIMHPKVAPLFKWSGMAFKPSEASTAIACDYAAQATDFRQLIYCNPIVANTALSYVAHFGFEEVYLFGVDGGFKKPGMHHSKYSVYYNKDGSEKETLGAMIRRGELKVQGNFGGTVFTSLIYNTGNHILEACLDFFKSVNCYNCSDGAKIKGAVPTHHEDVLIMNDLPDKQQIIDYIKQEMFIPRGYDESEFIQFLAFDKFNRMVDKLVKFLDKDFKSRGEVATALKLQGRYLDSYAKTYQRHIYYSLKGTCIYFQTVIKMMIYSFSSEQESLNLVKEGIKIYKTMMKEFKVKYANVINEVDSQNSVYIDMLATDSAED